MKRPSREERRAHAKREIASGDPRKSHADCPIEAAIEARRPPEARLSPFPQDDLVETPAPRPSLAPFGRTDSSTRGSRAPPGRSISQAPDIPCDYIELHTQSAFSFLRASSLPEDLVAAAAAAGHQTLG